MYNNIFRDIKIAEDKCDFTPDFIVGTKEVSFQAVVMYRVFNYSCKVYIEDDGKYIAIVKVLDNFNKWLKNK